MLTPRVASLQPECRPGTRAAEHERVENPDARPVCRTRYRTDPLCGLCGAGSEMLEEWDYTS